MLQVMESFSLSLFFFFFFFLFFLNTAKLNVIQKRNTQQIVGYFPLVHFYYCYGFMHPGIKWCEAILPFFSGWCIYCTETRKCIERPIPPFSHKLSHSLSVAPLPWRHKGPECIIRHLIKHVLIMCWGVNEWQIHSYQADRTIFKHKQIQTHHLFLDIFQLTTCITDGICVHRNNSKLQTSHWAHRLIVNIMSDACILVFSFYSCY